MWDSIIVYFCQSTLVAVGNSPLRSAFSGEDLGHAWITSSLKFSTSVWMAVTTSHALATELSITSFRLSTWRLQWRSPILLANSQGFEEWSQARTTICSRKAYHKTPINRSKSKLFCMCVGVGALQMLPPPVYEFAKLSRHFSWHLDNNLW